MRVLHVITGLGVGGAEQQLRLLLRHLPVDCDVVTLTNPGPVADGLIADGVRVAHLGMGGNRDLAALPRLVRRHPRGPLRRRAHPPLPGLRLRPDRRPARGGAGGRRHRTLPRRLADGGPAADRRGPRAVPRQRAARPGHRRRLADGRRPAEAAGACRAPRIEVVPNGIDLARFRFDPVARASAPASASDCPRTRTSSAASAASRRASASTYLIRCARPTPRRLLAVARRRRPRGAAPCGGPRSEAGVADRVLFTGETRRTCRTAPPAPTCPPSSPPWTCSPPPARRRPSGSRSWRRLAAGLPVLYVSCPAIEDLPPESAEGATPRTRRRGLLRTRPRRGPRAGSARPRTPRRRPPLRHHPQRRPAHGRVRGRRHRPP